MYKYEFSLKYPLHKKKSCYNPSLPLANKKWSLFGSIFFNKYAVFPVDMWLLDF